MRKIFSIIVVLIYFNTDAQVSNLKKAQKKKKTNNNITKQVNNEINYIYYTFLDTSIFPEKDFFGNNVSPAHSAMYSVPYYGSDASNSLEFCLTKNYKEKTLKSFVLLPHIFSDRQSLLKEWSEEKGSLFSFPMCSYLMEFGVMEQR
ncbi:hypothetical protein [Flavobacterium sp. 5]|uniref:hypothetical protein n=1 Tax=Flavobacterium sp. 5 TaxID=2035199 RepID=UPI000C2B6F91|nr:hypothetical protein [Flavobacterium sp. 5]PKB14990.1 hypothetical protein CLU82_0037 [Flavobacterium sp. 5]